LFSVLCLYSYLDKLHTNSYPSLPSSEKGGATAMPGGEGDSTLRYTVGLCFAASSPM
jgi:hypothetical protein